MEANYSDKYCVNDLVKIGGKLDFANLRTICEYCGYTYKPKGKKIYITKGEDTVLISRRNGSGYNRSIYAVYIQCAVTVIHKDSLTGPFSGLLTLVL